jgi:HIV Tat-specific factor 1
LRSTHTSLHRDKDGGGLKGDALVTYLKAPSVQLATTLLDGTPLRDGGKPMSVTQ